MSREQSYLSCFTPSLMSAEMLESILVKRQNLAARLVDRTEQSVLTPSKHQTLLLGPRGMGKSYLTALVYHRVKALPELADKIAIAYFAEEEWSIASLADLLLVILKALEREYGGLQSRIEKLYDLPVRDIETAASSLVREFVGEKTLFLLIENLNDVFRGLGDQDEWAFRSFLSERPFATILATTPSLFAGVVEHTSAFYGFFQNIYLEELTVDEATELLEKVAKRREDAALASFLKTPTGRARVQAVHDLAGGHPRTYLLFARLLTQETLDELVTPFMQLLDELTPYYQSRIQMLSPQQRKIVAFLCTARGATSVKEIAARNLLTSQTASSQLDKLEEMAYVRKTRVGRTSLYELREPLLRMVIEVKRGRGEPIRLIVDFLRRWYNRQERLSAASPDYPFTRYYLAASLDVQLATDDSPDFERAVQLRSESNRCFVAERWDSAYHKALCHRGRLLYEAREFPSALASLARALDLSPENAAAWFSCAVVQLASNDWDQCIRCIERGFACSPGSPPESWCTRELCCLLTAQEGFQTRVSALSQLYANNGAAGLLGLGLTESIPAVLSPNISHSRAESWRAEWQSARGMAPELEIPVRMLAAAVEWKQNPSGHALMSLPIEERRILASLLPGAPVETGLRWDPGCTAV